jgi:hypothetical protein
MDAKARLVLGLPGRLSLGGREFAVPAPTPTDAARTYEAMRELATRSCVSPLAYVNAARDGMDPAVLAEAVRAAVAMGSGGGVEPTREAVLRQYDTLEGVRWRVWYSLRRADATVTREWVESHVTDENRYELIDALDIALGYRSIDPKGPLGGSTSGS